ncbi:hypothetical protein DVA86_31950 [Streptomyces armeniacus]|uniref:Uncharacterized protein n=1 Tax=Streptomyces armeniacus TaxID=83291 RepID=A0A345XXY8_9ACTN|nr:hypothetical protein [Streptomyces armeniacus]AXK36504.1 hypothetical protein DVA86_31950 [Streptomyces armeniacus]
MTFDFPDELLHTQKELCRVRSERSRLLAALPSFAEASAQSGAAHWAPGDPPLGRSREQAEQEHQLRGQETELAAAIQAHPFWATLSGPALVDARSALKYAACQAE